MEATLRVWRDNKKKGPALRLVFVVDVSLAMQAGSRLELVTDATDVIGDTLGDGDELSVVAFNDKVKWVERGLPVSKAKRAALKENLKGVLCNPAGPRSALYQALAEATTYLNGSRKEGTTAAVVVVADRSDLRPGTKTAQDLLAQLALGKPTDAPIFAFVCGSDVGQTDLLKTKTGAELTDVAKASKGASRLAVPSEIRKRIFELAD
jgi:Mg-chelatase subunit ChlD